jgi:HrpA-like RNA helicase
VQIGLAGVVLQLKALGVRELSEFEFLERPSVAALKRAVELLLRLGALSPRGDLTPLGKDMVPARSLFVCVESARRSSALQYPA